MRSNFVNYQKGNWVLSH